MKKLLLFLLFVVASLSAQAMGHPHNVFSAHRKAKQYVPKTTECQQRTVCQCSKRTLIEYVRATLIKA
ncbi:hypothetical protein [Larkinella soli]|uniref:hypothetical protein n=1 Tax=Larkinella soli TaxID=1770527 RepID=UPI000FFC4D94|nr:hypothetical protein [Larkinella soli]